MTALRLLAACALSICALAGSANAQSTEAAPSGAAVSVVERYSMEDVSQELARRLSALPGVRGVERIDGMANNLRIVTHSDVTVRLDTLHARVNLADANPDAEYSRFETNVRKLLEQQDPFKLEQLRVVIRTTQAIDAFEEQTAASANAISLFAVLSWRGLRKLLWGIPRRPLR